MARKVVWTNGCFDVLHFGHIDFLRRCRKLGDWLVVGLNCDESIRRLKGPTRPIHNLHQRYRQLDAIRFVDRVAVFLDDTPCRIISQLRPDIVVKGPGYSVENMPEAEIVEEYGGQVIIMDGPNLSTTRILNLLEVSTADELRRVA